MQKLFIDRTFAIFDRLNIGRVFVDEYTETLAQLVGKNADAAIEFLFRIYDINDDGFLDFEELKEVLKASISESGMTFDDQENYSAFQFNEYICLQCNRSGDGDISYLLCCYLLNSPHFHLSSGLRLSTLD